MKINKKYLLICIALVLLGASFLYLPYLINKVPFEISTIDTREENFAFYTEFTRIIQQFIKTGEFNFYSWTSFLGNNFIISKAFYVSTDIFTIISSILNLNFWDSLILMQIVKCLVASVGMFYFLSRFRFKPTTIVIGSIMYAFCSSMSYFSVYPPFTTFFAFIPIYMLLLERAFIDNKYILYSLITMFLAITNYYFFFILSFFTAIYIIYRWLQIKGIENSKAYYIEFIKRVGILIFYYFIGVLLACFILVPTLFYIMQNQRVGNSNLTMFFSDYKIYFHSLASLFLPIHSLRNLFVPFVPSNYTMYENYLWAGSLLILGIPFIFIDKDKKRRTANQFVLVSYLLIVFIPLVNSIVHGFSEPSFRISIYFTFIFILISCQALENFIFSKKYYSRILLVLFTMTIGLFGISTIIEKKSITMYSESILIIFVTFIFLLTIGLVRTKKTNEKTNKLLLILVFVELITMWKVTINRFYINDERHSYKFMYDATHIMQYYPNQLNSYLDELDEANATQFYRVYYDEESMTWNMGKNASFFYNLKSTSTYDSLFSPSLQKLVEIAPEISEGADSYLEIKNGYLLDLVNVKYAIVPSADVLPTETDWQLVDNEYLGWISIYENKNFNTLGRLIPEAISYDQIKNVSDIKNYIISNEDNFEEINSIVGDESTFVNSSIVNGDDVYMDITSKGGMMLITIPYDKGWKVKVNDNEVTTYNINGGFIGIEVPEGYTEIFMHFSIYGLKIGIILSSFGLFFLIFGYLLQKRLFER
ncbi:MAG: YfhO family protein [Erysipelotrichaceae bacterium]